MATLGPDATPEEIDDELVFQNTLLESLGDVQDDDSSKREIMLAIADLEKRLQDHHTSSSPSKSTTSDSEVADSNDTDDTLSFSGEKTSKRPAADAPEGHAPKRHAQERPSANGVTATVRKFLSSQSGPLNSALQRQRQAEEQARRRRQAEEADALYALELSRQAESSSDAASRPPTAMPVPQFQPASTFARSEQRPAVGSQGAPPSSFVQQSLPLHMHDQSRVKPEPKSLSGRPQHTVPQAASNAGVIDLTGDSDSSQDNRSLIPGHTTQPARTMHDPLRQQANQQLGQLYSDHAKSRQFRLKLAQQGGGRLDPPVIGQEPLMTPMREEMLDNQEADHEREYEVLERRLHDHGHDTNSISQRSLAQLEMRQQREVTALMQRFLQEDILLQRRARGTQQVYNVPGAYPQDGLGSYAMSAQQAQMPSIYQPQSSQKPSLFSKIGQSLASFGDELSQLGDLMGIGGSVGPRRDYYDWDEGITDEQMAESLKNLMENIRPDEEIPIDERDVEVEAMTVTLKPYQAAGLKWLQNMEEGSNKGSILADDMGLGKTVQAIALMSSRKSEDPQRRTNLILAPVALLRQWKDEIETKLKRGRHGLSVFIHHGAAKKKSFEELRMFDVVITTFGTLAAEMRKRDMFEARKKTDAQATIRPNERCIFIDERSKWYRVIIDEAQNIKNRNTQSSRAASLLNSTYRLCMTGTPMMNSPEELFSLIRFLKIKPYNDLQKFQMDFTRPLKSAYDGPQRQTAMQRLQVLLKAILLRRQKKSLINGKPILVLPERIVEETNPVFSEEERDFYKALETQSRVQFNKFVQAGTVGKSYAHILVMLLRLRQACCHPHLVKDFGVALAADISQETMDDIARTLRPDVVERIKATNGEFECPVCYDAVQNPAIFVPCGHDTCADCYVKIKDSAQSGEYGDSGGMAKCPNCRGAIDPKQVIDYETFKKIHLPVIEEEPPQKEEASAGSVTQSEAEETDADDESDDSDAETESDTESLDGFIVDDDADEDSLRAPRRKGKALALSRPGGLNFSDSESEGLSETALKAKIKRGKQPEGITDADDDDNFEPEDFNKPKKAKKNRKKKKKSKDKAKEKETPKKKKAPQRTLAELKKLASRSKSAKKEYLRQVRHDFVMSAKIQKTMDLLKQIVEETDEKIIIFSQWTSLLDLLEVPIDEQGWGYHRYDGSMSARDRSDAIDAFKSTTRRPQIRLMLVSLKAGNAGLNLTCASQVIIMDPFWNPYIEEQAIDRAHRLGQEREVHVHRLLIEDTVEDRILALQEQKRKMINEALDEGAGQRLSRLNQQQLGYLFGVTREPPS